jgi:hypothetical protein
MLTQIGNYGITPIMVIVGHCERGFGDTTAMGIIEEQDKQISLLQGQNKRLLKDYDEAVDKLHRRNLQIKDLKAKILQIEDYIHSAFGENEYNAYLRKSFNQ